MRGGPPPKATNERPDAGFSLSTGAPCAGRRLARPQGHAGRTLHTARIPYLGLGFFKPAGPLLLQDGRAGRLHKSLGGGRRLRRRRLGARGDQGRAPAARGRARGERAHAGRGGGAQGEHLSGGRGRWKGRGRRREKRRVAEGACLSAVHFFFSVAPRSPHQNKMGLPVQDRGPATPSDTTTTPPDPLDELVDFLGSDRAEVREKGEKKKTNTASRAVFALQSLSLQHSSPPAPPTPSWACPPRQTAPRH